MKKSKKKLYTLLLSLSMLTSSNCVYAKEINIMDKCSNTLISNTSLLEDELTQQGINISNELNALKGDYQTLLANASTIEEQNSIQQLIDGVTKLCSAYSQSQNQVALLSVSDIIYTEPIAVVTAYFKANGYNLSAELLVHASVNKTKYSFYNPQYANRVTSSSVFKSIANGNSTVGSAAFPNSSGKINKDLYYAIHNFNYVKSSSGSKCVHITDLYDYDYEDYDSIGGIAVDIMSAAEDAGVLVPFYTQIVESI